jgi:hypothetical protein
MSNTRIWIVLGLLAVLVVAGAIAGVVILTDDKIEEPADHDAAETEPKAEPIDISDFPPAPEQTPLQIAQTMASEEFDGFSDEKQEAYYQEIIDAGEAQGEEQGRARMGAFFQAAQTMDDEQRERLMENGRELGMAFMERRLDEYYALSDEEKNAHLDERIDQIQQRQQRSESEGDGNRGGGRRGRGGRHSFTPERLKGLIEGTSAARRAKFTQYHKDLRDRMEERGISTDW